MVGKVRQKLFVQILKHVGLGRVDKLAAFLFYLRKYEMGSASIQLQETVHNRHSLH